MGGCLLNIFVKGFGETFSPMDFLRESLSPIGVLRFLFRVEEDIILMLKVSRLLRATTPEISSKFPPQLITLLRKLNSFGEFYLVGGCIRDALLGRTPKDFDVMVVAPSPQELEKILPVKQVGAAFPVYLYDTEDPELGIIEFAYARKETKTGIGYKGFDFEVVSDVKEDLARRDLTINALAWNPTAGLVSFDDRAMDDVQTNTLRHVTEAFAEDPLRVLRAARFSAQLPGDWKVDPETIKLMNSLQGELPSLALDRIRIELEKSLRAAKPGNFFQVLHQADCMSYWFPELESNLPALINLVNKSAKSVSLIEMYCLLAQTMQSNGDVKTFCKRLSLAWDREMALWRNIHACSFTSPKDFLMVYKGGRQGRLPFDSIYRLLEINGDTSSQTSLKKAVAALQNLKLQEVPPSEIPALMLKTVSSALGM